MFVNNQNSNIPSRPKLDATHRYTQLKEELHRRLIDNVDLMAYRSLSEEQLRREFRLGAEELCRHQPNLLSESERKRLIDELLDEVLGLGPLEPLLRDADISDILVNGPRTIYVERAGRLERTSITFRDEEHLLHIVQKIVGRVGRRIDESSPMADARLPDGSRVNAIIRPLARRSLALNPAFGSRPLDVQELVAQGSATLEMLSFLSACIGARLNVLVSGGTGTGKTTLLNVLSSFIPTHERLATIGRCRRTAIATTTWPAWKRGLRT